MRDQYLSLCQRIAEVVLPHRANFTKDISEGANLSSAKFDSTGMLAHRNLKDAMGAMLKPRHEKWIFVRPEDDRLKYNENVLLWCEEVEQRMWNAIYSPRAQFMRYSGEVDDDLVAFGQGHLYLGVNRPRSGLLFRSWHIKDAVYAENLDGQIDKIFLDWMLTLEQAVDLVGKDNTAKLPERLREELKKDKPDWTAKYPFYLCIYPNEDYQPRRAANDVSQYAPFKECIIAPDCDTEIAVSGYFDFPVATPRWDTSSGEWNARSPASIALGDILSANQIGKTMLKAGHLAVEPPLVAPHNGIVGRAKIYPGGMTYFNADVVSGYGREAPIRPLYNGLNLPFGENIQRDVRDQIWLAFFRNVLNLPIDGPQMTATEVQARRQEFLRTVGPIFGRLEADYTAAIATRVFGILERAGVFSPPPEELQGTGIRFEFVSPVFKVLKQVEMDAYHAWMNDMAAVATVKGPHVFDNIDEDVVAREGAMIRGMPQRWLKPVDAVTTIRERRAEMEQQEQMKNDAERAAGAAVNVAKVVDLSGARAQKKAA